jgi:hypothetical protein
MPGEMVPLGIWFSCEHSGNMARAARIMVRIGPGRLEGFVLVDAVNSQDIPVSRSTVFSRKMRWRPKENTFPWVSILFLGTPYILRKSNRRILKRSEIKSPNFEAVEVSMAQVEEKRNTVAERGPVRQRG